MMMRCYITGNNSQSYFRLLIPFLLVISFACKFIFFNLTSGLIFGEYYRFFQRLETLQNIYALQFIFSEICSDFRIFSLILSGSIFFLFW